MFACKPITFYKQHFFDPWRRETKPVTSFRSVFVFLGLPTGVERAIELTLIVLIALSSVRSVFVSLPVNRFEGCSRIVRLPTSNA